MAKYTGTGTYRGEEFEDEFGSPIEIGNDEINGVYCIRFPDGTEFDNVFEEEIDFDLD